MVGCWLVVKLRQLLISPILWLSENSPDMKWKAKWRRYCLQSYEQMMSRFPAHRGREPDSASSPWAASRSGSSLSDSQSELCSFVLILSLPPIGWTGQRAFGSLSSLGSTTNLFFGLSSKLHPEAQLTQSSLLWKRKLTLWIELSLALCDDILSAEPWRADSHLPLTIPTGNRSDKRRTELLNQERYSKDKGKSCTFPS